MNFNPNVGGGEYTNQLQIVLNEFYWNGGSCLQLDALIKKVRDKSVVESLKRNSNKFYRDALIYHKSTLESIFNDNNCSDKIETLRQNESAVLVTKQSIEQEKAVLKPSNIDQRIYIVGGAVVLLVGLLILVKK
jgi:hypothetical protein